MNMGSRDIEVLTPIHMKTTLYNIVELLILTVLLWPRGAFAASVVNIILVISFLIVYVPISNCPIRYSISPYLRCPELP